MKARVALALFVTLGTVAAPRPGAADAAGSDVSKTQVCFVVHNPGGAVLPGGPALPADPVARPVVGEVFTTAQSDPRRVLLLVHGHSWWQNEWDLRPDFSIARNFAQAGYVVISYDRLGNGASTYAEPQRETLTFSGQRQMLHEVVEQLRGTSVLRGGEANPCAGTPVTGVGRRPKIALVGHSQGAVLVNGYAGDYGPGDPGHIDALVEDRGKGDTVLMASSVIPGNGACAPGAPCPLPGLGVRATAIVTERLAANAGRDFSLGLTDGSYDPYLSWQPKLKAVDPLTCANNTFGMLWPAATRADALVDEACNPANQETVPYNEFVSISALHDNLAAIDAALPVLLVFAEFDGLRPGAGDPDAATCNPDPQHQVGCRQPLVDEWQSTCPCGAHVSQWTLPDAGHSIALDRTMPLYTAKVTAWLATQGLAPRR